MADDHDDVAIPLAYCRTAGGIVVTLADAKQHRKALRAYASTASPHLRPVPVELGADHLHYCVPRHAGGESAGLQDASRDSAVVSATRVGSHGRSDNKPADPHAPTARRHPEEQGDADSEHDLSTQDNQPNENVRRQSIRHQILVNGTPFALPEQDDAATGKQGPSNPEPEYTSVKLSGEVCQHFDTTLGRFVASNTACTGWFAPGDEVEADGTIPVQILIVDEVFPLQPNLGFASAEDDPAQDD